MCWWREQDTLVELLPCVPIAAFELRVVLADSVYVRDALDARAVAQEVAQTVIAAHAALRRVRVVAGPCGKVGPAQTRPWTQEAVLTRNTGEVRSSEQYCECRRVDGTVFSLELIARLHCFPQRALHLEYDMRSFLSPTLGRCMHNHRCATSYTVATRLLGPLKMQDRKSTRLNSSHSGESRMPSSA